MAGRDAASASSPLSGRPLPLGATVAPSGFWFCGRPGFLAHRPTYDLFSRLQVPHEQFLAGNSIWPLLSGVARFFDVLPVARLSGPAQLHEVVPPLGNGAPSSSFFIM